MRPATTSNVSSGGQPSSQGIQRKTIVKHFTVVFRWIPCFVVAGGKVVYTTSKLFNRGEEYVSIIWEDGLPVMKPVKKRLLSILMIIFCIGSIWFVHQNYSFYDQTIVKVLDTELTETTAVTDVHGNEDTLFVQQMTAVLKNGRLKGQEIQLANTYTASGAFDHRYRTGDELFVSIDSQNDDTLSGTITEVKRDKSIVLVAWIFIFTLLIIGQKQGLLAIAGFTLNVFVLSFALDLYVGNANLHLLAVSSVCIILFAAISIVFVNGLNEKAYAALIATLLGTFFAMAAAFAVIWLTGGKGLRYEEMQFLTRPYEVIFMAGLFIGSLGAIMDVAITMASSMFALYDSNPHISDAELKASGLQIGRDIMGTITNILFFAYVSGSIPMILLYLKNAAPLGFAFSMNLSLELARALAGAIGITAAIPISLYCTMIFIKRKKAQQ